MAKELAILAVSMITLLVAGYAAYSVMELSDSPTPRSVVAEKDYTGELKLIQSSLNDINKKLEALESDIDELQIIKDELEDLKPQTQPTTQKPVIQPTQPIFDIATDKPSYKVGDTIIITAKGVLSQNAVKLDLYSSLDELIVTQIAYSDSAGKLVYEMKLPSFIKTGNYKLKALYNNIVDEITVSVLGSPPSDTPTQPDNTSTQSDPIVNTTGLSFSLDKGSYKPDDIVWVSGKGAPNSSVVLKMTSPNGKIQVANTSTLSDGSFKPVFILPSDAKAGDWTIVATQGDKEAKVTFKVYTQ